ncbi:MAG: cytochrome c [Steroidobacteraceae bacterium]
MRCLAAMLSLVATGTLPADNARGDAQNLTYHGNAQRSGWYDAERRLTPERIRSGDFGLIFESDPLAGALGMPPRLFASPLYVTGLELDGSRHQRGRHDVVYAASTTGYVAAINASATPGHARGTTLWQRRIVDAPCGNGTRGILSTPVIDRNRRIIYVVGCDQTRAWVAHALDLATGEPLPGWPLALSAEQVNVEGVNANGANRFPSGVAMLQRGALNLSADGRWLFIPFGGEPVSGWLLSIDTRGARIAAAFSVTARTEEGVGGLWASGGVAIDSDGYVHVASGSSVLNALAGMGHSGVYPDSAGNWGQSILRLGVDSAGRLRLAGTYTPFNYCQAGGQDLDLGSGTPIVVDLAGSESQTPHLLVLGGSKQGNAYLLDRRHMPGNLVKRQPCAADLRHAADQDGSLLAPDVQPSHGVRGPLNVFGPYSDRFGMGDLAKSRSTAAYFRAANGRHFVYMTGTTKAAEDSGISVPPSLARLEIVAHAMQPAYLRIDAVQPELVFQNPGSAVISSHHGHDGIVWVLDVNKPRSASLYGEDAPQPVLYAIDADKLELLWRSPAGLLSPGGKYNEPVVANGMVFVGTDRIQVFGLGAGRSAANAHRPRSEGEGTTTRGSSYQPAAPGTRDDAAGLYVTHCAACHDQERPDVPPRARLARHSADEIIAKLTTGTMQSHANGLTPSQVESLARWLTRP